MTRRGNLGEVFISYSGKDQPLAGVLSDSLRRRGVSTWSDLDLRAGSDWQKEIADALRRASAVIVVVTPNSLESNWVKSEWSTALTESKRVIPAVAYGARFEDLPSPLAAIHGVSLNEDFDRGVLQIVEAVGDLQQSSEPAPSEHVDIRVIVEDIVDKKLASLGVDRLTSAAAPENDPDLVFVVTSFEADMQPAFEAIEAAARVVGLRAERVSDVPGDYRITDRIMSSIRRARFIVVDLTHERPNVYFELGFARGLGKTVITIIREGAKAHFDVQDWTYLKYVDSRPLERALVERFKYETDQPSGGTSVG
jgi:hypothetical protein